MTLHISPLAGLDGVFGVRSGPLACTAIRLDAGELCLYSPLPNLSETEFTALEELGRVSILMAPNHYHHRGIADHLQRFPKARLICAPLARPRLQKQTGLSFEALDVLTSKLPPNIQILEPVGLKTGEIWLQIAGGADLAWIVCDGFSEEAGMPAMLKTFPTFGIRDHVAYKLWVMSRIAERPPTILIPCHGAPVSRPDLGCVLPALLDQHLRQPAKLKVMKQ